MAYRGGRRMKKARKLPAVSRRFYRPEQYLCPECQRRLCRAVTLSERTIITLQGVIKVVHAGYRCPNPECAARSRTYRSAQADMLALIGFTFGLDIVLLIGQLRLGFHQTVDETHREVLRRLEPLGVSISRREILYLFDAYCTLLRAGTQAKDDEEWMKQVQQNGGIIVSIVGIPTGRGDANRCFGGGGPTGAGVAARRVAPP